LERAYNDSADGRPFAAIFRSPLFHAHETFVRAHALGLNRYRPLMVGLEAHGNVPPALEADMVIAGPGERAMLKLLGRSSSLASRIRAYRPALVHAHFAPDGLLALPLAEGLGVPLVTTLHGFDVGRTRGRMAASGRLSWMRYGLLGRRLMARGRLFLAVSEALRAKAVARGFPADRTILHYNGVDLDAFRPAERGPEPGLILHVGRLVEKKGTHLLIRALAEVRRARPDARLAVVGDGPLRPRLEAQAASLGLGGSISFLGSRPASEVADWMRRAWLLAAPSLTAGDGDAEGLPTVLAEAAACGLPAIGSRHSGIPEAIVDGGTGFLVPEGAVEPLARHIAGLLAAPARRGAMGRAARALAEEKFDSIRQSARLEAHYDRLVAGRAARLDRAGADSR
jgi:glycosyltransferase involved in cell wall biosynthesis